MGFFLRWAKCYQLSRKLSGIFCLPAVFCVCFVSVWVFVCLGFFLSECKILGEFLWKSASESFAFQTNCYPFSFCLKKKMFF